MRSLARNECTLASNKKIHNDTGVPLGEDMPLILSKSMPDSIGEISYDTVSDYLDIFDRLFLIDNQIAFDPNLKSSVRVGKVSKRHLVDPALAIAALGASKERLMKDLNAFGFFFESLCERDLRIYAETMGAGLFHYRDDSGREVDAIVELPDGRWGAFEIKLGANQIEDAAKNLLDFRKSLEKHGASRIPDVLCVICGLTEYSYLRNDGVYVVAVTVLGP